MKEISSAEIGKLMEALSKAQALIEGAKEDSINPFFKSKYADLSSVWNACKDPLTKNGLAVVQTVDSNENGHFLVTTLGHASGQWIRSFMPLILTKSDPQTLGSTITYARRFALSAIAGICPIDDDGESITKHVRDNTQIKDIKKISDLQRAEIEFYLKENPELEEKVKAFLNIKEIKEMRSEDFPKMLTRCKKEAINE